MTGVSYRVNGTHTSLEAVFYYMDYDNQLVLTGEINDVGSPMMMNAKDSYRTGIEIITGIRPLDKLSWDMNLTFSRNRILNFTDFVDDWDNWGSQLESLKDETPISFSPAVIGGSKISYDVFKGLNFSLMSKFVGKQYIDNSGSEEYTHDSYFVNDIQLQYSFDIPDLEELSFRLLLNNVLNTEYETNAWIYKYSLGGKQYSMDGYFPQAGFHILAGMTLRF